MFMMPFQHSRPGAHAPRRALAATVTIVSLFILALFALAQLGAAPSKGGRFAARFAKPETSDNPFLSKPRAAAAGDKYLIGVGKADITGPVVEINFGGYADLSQVGTGLRQRIYARSFIIGEVGNPQNRFVYVIIDAVFGDTALRNGVLEGLTALGSGYSMYGQSNVALTGTHSHSGPGGWFNYLLPQITSLGFDRQGYQAIVDGTVLSIKRAHESLQEVRAGHPASHRSCLLTVSRATLTLARRASTTQTSTGVHIRTLPIPSRRGRSTQTTWTRT